MPRLRWYNFNAHIEKYVNSCYVDSPEESAYTKRRTAGGMNFDDTLRQLDETLRRLEDGDLTLDEALSLFERGVSLVREAEKFLNEAEQKITLLTQDGEEVAFAPAHTSKA